MSAALVAVALLAFTSVETPLSPIAVPMPCEVMDEGWRRDGEPRVWSDANLYGHIDGGAELFLEFGFVDMTEVRCVRADAELAFELYRMSDPLAALGIYLAKAGRETPDPGLPARNNVGRYQLSLVRGAFFVIAANPSGEAALVPDMVALAGRLASALPPGPSRDPLGPLPPAGRVPGTERMARGPVALEPIVTLGEGDALSLGRTHTVLIARYRDDAGAEHTRLQVTYPDAASAGAALSLLVEGLDSQLTPLSVSPTRLVFRSYDETFGEAALEGAQLVVRVGLAARP